MDVDQNKKVCAACNDWQGKREKGDGVVRVKASARGQCQRLKKVKPPHGGCDEWHKWKGE